MFNRVVASFACVLSLAVAPSFAFGPRGHAIVGAIADQKLAGTATADKVAALIDGLTLEKAALLPDTIKSFDAHPNAFVLAGHPELTNQLRAFLKANPHNMPALDHHAFHFTDVPVEGASHHASGTVGRPEIDIVHMMKFCIGVLKGSEPEDNPKKITKPVALILLAHYVGDIHQPLHVGAEYFDNTGKPINPDTHAGQANNDKGGNGLTLHLMDAGGHLRTVGNLHGYWDSKAVESALALLHEEILADGHTTGVSDADVASFLAGKQPTGFAVSSSPIEKWSEEWADEILPVAKNAHKRLKFSHMLINPQNHTAAGQALEKPIAKGSDTYADFAAKVTRKNIHVAGWRLALVVKRILP